MNRRREPVANALATASTSRLSGPSESDHSRLEDGCAVHAIDSTGLPGDAATRVQPVVAPTPLPGTRKRRRRRRRGGR